MHIAERMTNGTAWCSAGDSLEMAAQLLWENRCGSVPVVDVSGQVLGSITDREICMAALMSGKRLAELLVGDALDARIDEVAIIEATDSQPWCEPATPRREAHRLSVIDVQDCGCGNLGCKEILRWVDDGGANLARARDALHSPPAVGPATRHRGPRV